MLAFRNIVTYTVQRALATPLVRSLSTTPALLRDNDRHRDRRDLVRGLPAKDEGIAGAQDMIDVDAERQR